MVEGHIVGSRGGDGAVCGSGAEVVGGKQHNVVRLQYSDSDFIENQTTSIFEIGQCFYG